MEKLQPILDGLKKHHFWMVCLAAVCAISFGIYLASAEMPDSFKANKMKVESKFADLERVQTRRIAKSWPEDADKRGRELHGKIMDGAKSLLVGQEATWPKELGKEFAADAARLGRNNKWPDERRAAYQKVAPKEFDRIVKIAEGVQWAEGVEKQLRDQFVWPAPPTPEFMFEAQEKLWVIEKVLTSIAEANKGASDRLNLPVSLIEVFEIGPAALRTAQARKIEMPGAPAPPPVPAAAPAAAPGAPAPQPGVAGAVAAPAGGAAPPPAPASAPAEAAPPPVPQIAGLRAYHIRLRMKMNPDVLGHVETALLNSGRIGVPVQNRLPIVIDDIYFTGEVKLVQEGGPRVEPAPPAVGPNGPPAGAAPPAPGTLVQAPAANPPGANLPGAHQAGQPAEKGPDRPASVPHLVQVPRGKVVELLATAYFVDMGQVEALKVAMNDRGRL